jgi:polysaccharide export outer membrane protein
LGNQQASVFESNIKNMLKKQILMFLLLGAVSVSCVRYKNVVYFLEEQGRTYEPYPTYVYKIRPFDILYIKLSRISYEESTNMDFNNDGGMMRGGGAMANAMLYLIGYTVSHDGFIDLPLVGQLKVAGLTTQEIKAIVDEKLEEYIKNPSVSVKLANYRISVIGEVLRPGVQYVYEDKWTLMQTLSNAGGPTELANIKRVKLVREVEGKTTTTYIDLSRPELIASEHYFMQPHDVVYIEPTKAKVFVANSRSTSIIISSLSLIVVVTNLILNQSRR